MQEYVEFVPWVLGGLGLLLLGFVAMRLSQTVALLRNQSSQETPWHAQERAQLSGGLDGVQDVLKNILNALSEEGRGLRKELKTVQSTSQEAQVSLTRSVAEVTEGLRALRSDLTGLSQSLRDEIAQSRESASQGLGEGVAAVVSAVGTQNDALNQTLEQGVTGLREATLTLSQELSQATSEIQSWGEGQRQSLSQLGTQFEGQAIQAANLVEQAGRRVAEFEASSERHGQVLRSAALASMEELTSLCEGIASEVRLLSEQQGQNLATQEKTTQVLERLAGALDGYVEVLRETAA